MTPITIYQDVFSESEVNLINKLGVISSYILKKEILMNYPEEKYGLAYH